MVGERRGTVLYVASISGGGYATKEHVVVICESYLCVAACGGDTLDNNEIKRYDNHVGPRG